MSKSYYVYSTLAANTAYVFWETTPGGQNTEKRRITIKGGSGVANKNIITPLGIATRITEEEAKLLEEHKLFKRHQASGYVRIEESESDPEKVITSKGMKTRDVSAPIVPEDYKPGDGAQPIIRKTEI